MRGTTVVMWVGVFPALMLACFWVMSHEGDGYASFRPGGASMAPFGIERAYQAGFEDGTLYLRHSRMNLSPSPTSDYFDTEFVPFSGMGKNHPRPTWRDVAIGRLWWTTGDPWLGTCLMVPFWVVVVPLLGGSVAGFVALRRRESRMIAEGRQA